MSKIIDIFSYDGKVTSLEKKINYTNDLVDFYWIFDVSEDNSLSETVKNNFQYVSEKISIIPKVNLKIFDDRLVNLFIEKKVSFDDIIILSEIDEIYTSEVIGSLNLHLPFSPQIMPVYESDESLKIVSSESSLGPVVLYRTTYTRSSNLTNNLLSKRSGYLPITSRESVLDHGYKITRTNSNTNFHFILD